MKQKNYIMKKNNDIIKQPMKNINTMKIMKKFLFLKIFFLALYSPTIFAITCSTGSGGSSGSYSWDEARGNGDANGFTKRWNHASASFDDKLWVIAGNSASNGTLNDVWSSTNGSTWTNNTAGSSKKLLGRAFHQAVSFGGKLWVIGGFISGFNVSEVLNDVWNSTNGKTWTQVTDNAGFPARYQFTAVVFNDGSGEKMWVIGGNDDTNKLNDVWSSTNGKTWKKETDNAGFSDRSIHQAVNFDNKLWVMGGLDNDSDRLNDVWRSTNGKDWTQVTSSATFSARYGHQAVNFDNKLWVMGGIVGSNAQADVWSSTNGKDWTKVTDSAGFGNRRRFSSAVLNNRVWTFGGAKFISFNFNISNTVWSMAKD